MSFLNKFLGLRGSSSSSDDEIEEDDSNEETGQTCTGCNQPLLRSSSYTAAYEDGNNSEAYVKCSHCGFKNYLF